MPDPTTDAELAEYKEMYVGKLVRLIESDGYTGDPDICIDVGWYNLFEDYGDAEIVPMVHLAGGGRWYFNRDGYRVEVHPEQTGIHHG